MKCRCGKELSTDQGSNRCACGRIATVSRHGSQGITIQLNKEPSRTRARLEVKNGEVRRVF